MTVTSQKQAKNYRYYIDSNIGSELTRRTLVLILAGGAGSRLHGLTNWRAKPAVPFGGKYRIIDFALSNCVNSGLRRIGVLTQYKSHSLIRHLQRAWGFMRAEIGEFVEIIPAQQRVALDWYRGTADALYQNIDIIRRHAPDNVIVLGGDHIYTMDYSKMLYQHAVSGADLTVGCIEVTRKEACEFGVMSVDEDFRITKFTEKPDEPECMPGKPDSALASMGIYIFSTAYLYASLIDDAANPESDHDFGKNIVPSSIATCVANAYPFLDKEGKPAYWRDVGNVDSYWKANMELCDIEPELADSARVATTALHKQFMFPHAGWKQAPNHELTRLVRFLSSSAPIDELPVTFSTPGKKVWLKAIDRQRRLVIMTDETDQAWVLSERINDYRLLRIPMQEPYALTNGRL